jgi:hypothetical protein
MTRIELSLGAGALALLVWLQPGAAFAGCDGCGNGNFGGGGQATSHVIIPPPPIAGLQIQSASSPISNDWISPPAPQNGSDSDVTTIVPAAGPDGLASVADLDRGADDWTTIEPGMHNLIDGFWPGLDRIQPAQHAHAVPPRSEVAISTTISMEVPAAVEHKGVPGIDPMTSGSGNRSLWFQSDGGN